ncbi:fused MFS/spermidine synthase [Limnothrix sp. FACHB-881]|nr:fused MFS/spermidine synthase [Limnothrix sp. FACHB-881]
MKKTIFSVALFGSAFLLFWVQFIVAKSLLPLLGGTPAVWNVCQAFFQMMLLAGYGYAAWLSDRPSLRSQFWIHGAVAIGGGLALWSQFNQVLSQSTITVDRPLITLLQILFLGVALPFFALSATAPLLQRWVSQTRLDLGKDPYVLYAASNAGSLLGVLGYPGAIEPLFSLLEQRQFWQLGYGIELLLIGACVLITWRDRNWNSAGDSNNLEQFLQSKQQPGLENFESLGDFKKLENLENLEELTTLPEQLTTLGNTPASSKNGAVVNRLTFASEPESSPNKPLQPTWRDRLQWALFAFLPASLSLGVTTYVTTDLAAIPLFWAIPLSLYLLTYIVAFSNWRWSAIAYPLSIASLPLLVTPLVFWSRLDGAQNLWVMLPFHWLGFAIAAFVCHQTLALIKPSVTYLTQFYFWIALGGALGGSFNAIAAPSLFSTTQEYPLILILTLLSVINSHRLPKWSWIAIGLGLGALLAGINFNHLADYWAAYCVAFGLLASIGWALQLRKTKIISAGLAIILMMQFSVGLRGEVLLIDRSFFGVNRVVRDRSRQVMSLLHGSTLHGQQSLLPQRRDRPLTYFTETGPIGEFFAGFNQSRRDRVAVLGLGIGTLASYAQPDQQWTFYEIDPTVKSIAQNPAYFSFLELSKGKVTVEIGDGRLKMQTVGDRSLDLVIMDAFSSDSIPVHLITREAIASYLNKLTDRGLILVNITNRYLDLLPVLGAISQDLRLTAIHRWDLRVLEAEKAIGKTPSHWVAIARSPQDLNWLIDRPQTQWQPVPPQPPSQLWTDDRSSLLSVIRSR